jgi:hypothetical protein
MADFRCWDPENCEEDDAKLVKASTAEWAAERYMELEWPDLDYISTMTVHVLDEQGLLTVWQVTAEPAVTFSASSSIRKTT